MHVCYSRLHDGVYCDIFNSPVEACWCVSPVWPTDTFPPNSPCVTIFYPVQHFHLLLPLLVLMATFWVLPWGDVVCMLLTVTSRLITSPWINNLTPFCLLWPGKHHCIWWIYKCSRISMPYCIWYMPNTPNIYVVGCTWTHKCIKLHEQEHTKAKALLFTYVYMWTSTQNLCCLGGWQSSFSLFPLASIMVQACCQRACIAWGEVPICGSMWQGGSKSPLMNQYVGGLSLWWGCPRNATLHPGKNVCICSHQTLFMSADNLNLNGSCRIRVEEIWTHSQNPVVITCINETEEERLKGGKQSGLLPLGVVGEKSFSDPTSDTWKNKKAKI